MDKQTARRRARLLYRFVFIMAERGCGEHQQTHKAVHPERNEHQYDYRQLHKESTEENQQETKRKANFINTNQGIQNFFITIAPSKAIDQWLLVSRCSKLVCIMCALLGCSLLFGLKEHSGLCD